MANLSFSHPRSPMSPRPPASLLSLTFDRHASVKPTTFNEVICQSRNTANADRANDFSPWSSNMAVRQRTCSLARRQQQFQLMLGRPFLCPAPFGQAHFTLDLPSTFTFSELIYFSFIGKYKVELYKLEENTSRSSCNK